MNYKKGLVVLTILFLLLSCSSGVSNEKGNSLLWKISGNGLEKPSYLFGTHHLVPISFLDSIHGIDAAFEETEQTVGELDMGNMTEMQRKIMGEGLMPPEVTYQTLFSPEDAALLDSMLHALVGVGLNQLGQLKPAMLSNLISLSLYQQYYPSVTSEKNLDQYFQEEALKRSRPVMGLETAEDQIDVLLNLQSLERQAEMLICMVKHPGLLKEQMDEFQAAYHAQDIETLHQLYEKETPDDPCPSTEEEDNALNGDRNRKWLEKLPSVMEEKSSFIAVGCLHLPGDEGLIEGLRKLGYNVEAVKR
ncbi:TraB/GumN family protein [uncultured Proteiniphilum sp.]|uniref:TraB/GumN family protein n=1 Tax=uncultured Proteiniphilum sp. TaxID=497637 RepID=UPI00260F10EB|nr:TraB/GumN family protein [uncultured Proteiniphilum sp.]